MFSPNGDGENDVLYVLGKGIETINLTIYNRWGNKIYESNQGAYNSMPWDGTYNGEELPVATYYYIIEFNDNSTENAIGIVSVLKTKL